MDHKSTRETFATSRRDGSWRYAPALLRRGEHDGRDDAYPGPWIGEFRLREEARRAAESAGLNDFFVAWIEEWDYTTLMMSGWQVLAYMREDAELFSTSTACFDELNEQEISMLDKLLRDTVKNWESWLVRGERQHKACNIVAVKNLSRYNQ